MQRTLKSEAKAQPHDCLSRGSHHPSDWCEILLPSGHISYSRDVIWEHPRETCVACNMEREDPLAVVSTAEGAVLPEGLGSMVRVSVTTANAFAAVTLAAAAATADPVATASATGDASGPTATFIACRPGAGIPQCRAEGWECTAGADERRACAPSRRAYRTWAAVFVAGAGGYQS